MKKSISVIIILCCVMTCVFSVNPTVTAKSKKISLSKKTVSMKIGNSAKVRVKNCKKAVKWYSENKKIAAVSSKGVIKGIKKGTTKIIAKVAGKKLKCSVKVKDYEAKIEYKNTVFTKNLYENIEYITCRMIYGNKKITSKIGISTIFNELASISSLKDITSSNAVTPTGGTSFEMVMKDGTSETVNVSGNLYFMGKTYEPSQTISDSVSLLLKQYLQN